MTRTKEEIQNNLERARRLLRESEMDVDRCRSHVEEANSILRGAEETYAELLDNVEKLEEELLESQKDTTPFDSDSL